MRIDFFRPVFLARVFFILLSTWMASYVAWETRQDPILFALLGLSFSLLFVLIEYSTQAISSRKILFAAGGAFLGLIFAETFYPTAAWLMGLVFQVVDNLKPIDAYSDDPTNLPRDLVKPATARYICHMMFGYFGLVLALRHADWLRIGNLKFYLANPTDRPKVLDSSAIIDGRIVSMIGLKLLDGSVVVPTFVLNEIQRLSDSGDTLRRSRGKRGLEILDRLRAECRSLDLITTDYPDLDQVDEKLVRLCREMNADLVTTDFNLQKIAQFHQVQTLNLNELSSALRTSVYVGEMTSVKIVKPGKESGQGVGYLEDGSMVVVDDAAGLAGRECPITIVNIIQNASGRLVFGRLLDETRSGSAR